MQKVRLFGVKQEARIGTTYKLVRVDDAGNIVPDEKAPDYLDFSEVTAPAAPATNVVRLYAEDNGSGKTRIVAKFPTGADVVLGTQA
jgi:predicted transcriptional regulator